MDTTKHHLDGDMRSRTGVTVSGNNAHHLTTSTDHLTAGMDRGYTPDKSVLADFYVNKAISPYSNAKFKVQDNLKSAPYMPVYLTSKTTSPPSDKYRPDNSRRNAETRAKVIDACDHFGEISTFHGMRLVCARDSHITRRIFWLALMACCFTALSLQIREQVLHFYSNPKTINVDRIYTNYVEFPTITICNENIFKISSAHELGLYNVINKMFAGKLNLTDVINEGVSNLTLYELNLMVGNRIELMLLRCRWSHGERCTPDNFTTIVTDQGVCFTFNGPDNERNLTVYSPGASRGLQLTLNIEEYERMTGSHVASGIHLLVHNKREYPLVEQMGQAVAAGSHTFIALSLKKDKRLGHPYDNCRDGRLVHVPSSTYDYAIPSCKMDCYVTFVVDKCGCRDYFMPGNSPVCTMTQYVLCLRDAQVEYDLLEDKFCECHNPCSSVYTEPSYSYGALSKSAIDKLKPGDIEKIKPRYRRALDVVEYLTSENQYKKDMYTNYSNSLSSLRAYYKKVFEVNVLSAQQNLKELRQRAEKIYQIRYDLYTTQTTLVEKMFGGVQGVERKASGESLEDYQVFTHTVLNKLQKIGETTNPSLRELLYILLTEEIQGRISIVNSSLQNFDGLIETYEQVIANNGSLPLESLGGLDGFEPQDIIPKRLLSMAFNQSEDGQYAGGHTRGSLLDIAGLLEELSGIATEVYGLGNITTDLNTRAQGLIAQYKQACIRYLLQRDNFYDAVLQRPISQLNTQQSNLKAAKLQCDDKFVSLHSTLTNMQSGIHSKMPETLRSYTQIDALLRDYLSYFNVSKFQIADVFASEHNKMVSLVGEMNHSLVSNFDEMKSHAIGIKNCFSLNHDEIFLDETLNAAYQARGREFGVEQKDFLQFKNDALRLLGDLESLVLLEKPVTELQSVVDAILIDANQFTEKAAIKLPFFRENFIFVDIFFSEISYTITEQQVAYDIINLLSDIGGSMGLLIGASAVSMFEFMDFFCHIGVLLWKRSKPPIDTKP